MTEDERITEDATGAACTPEGCDAPIAAPTGAAALPAADGPGAGQLDVVSDAICPWCWIGKRQLDAQVAGVGRTVGLEFRHDRMTRTPSTVEAHRLIRLAEPSGRQDAVVEAVFRAYFQEGRDIGDRATLAAIGAEAGLDAATLDAFAEGFAAREEVLAEDHALRGAGLSGVPSFILDRHLLFSGAVPAAQMAAALRHAHQVLAGRRAGDGASAG
jgi:predicted DsbA family dithiol-disulfide isomerase